MRALDRKLLRDLWHLRGQVLAIALVIAGGVALFVVMFGTLQSLEATRDAYYERYRFAHVFAQAKRAPESLAAPLSRIPGVQTVETRVVADVTLDLPGVIEPAVGRLVSQPVLDGAKLNLLALRSGRGLLPGNPFEAVVSEAFAEAHGLRPGDRIEAILNQRKRSFRVVGVALSPEYIFSMGPGQFLPDDRSFGVLWVPRETIEAAFDLDGAFNDLSLSLMPGTSPDAVIEVVDRLLAPYGGLGAQPRADQISHWFLENELEQLWALATTAPPIFLAVAAFLLNVAVARMIELEREQIGLLKAFGYSDFAVGAYYARFVLAIVAVGVTLGCGLGLWLGRGMTELYTAHFRFPFLYYRPDPGTFIFAAGFAMAAGLLGAWSAVRRAVRLPPAEAMRPAAPPSYRRGILERSGALAWVTQGMRIILRHISRFPGRAAMTVAGIATAVAIVVASTFSLGAVEHMVEVQFFQAQRQHATIGFVEPRAEGALAEIERLPGVLAAEPFRSVPVRLRAGSRQERVALQGLEPAPALQRLLDTELRPLTVPPEGLLLSASVAERLAVNRGQSVTVEVLEGRRQVLQLPVTAVSEEYIGGSVAMDRRSLNRLLLDGAVISGAHLLLDQDRIGDFYATAKSTPIVTGVTLQRRMLESFRQQIAESFLSVVLVVSLFAGMIAFGVVYNAARIMLSERGRELASLRVLGFTRFEVGYILLGELAILTVVALPLGCLAGYGLASAMASGFETDLYRIPLVVEPSTYGLAVAVVVSAAVLSAAIIARRLYRLDLVAVLKTRE